MELTARRKEEGVKKGDIVSVKEIGHEGVYRIVWEYNEEPKQFLVTKEEDFQAQPKCYHVLQASCTLVREGEPPSTPAPKKRTTPPIIKRPWVIDDAKYIRGDE
jgi:hypothetical protein